MSQKHDLGKLTAWSVIYGLESGEVQFGVAEVPGALQSAFITNYGIDFWKLLMLVY